MTYRIAFARLVPVVAVILLLGVGCLPPLPPTPPRAIPIENVNLNVNQEQQSGDGAASGTRLAGNAILAYEQLPAKIVKIAVVNSEKSAFVVVRDSSDVVLGTSALLQTGQNLHVEVNVSRSTVAGESVGATLYADDGDGTFDSSDTVMTDTQGAPLQATISITLTPLPEPSLEVL